MTVGLASLQSSASHNQMHERFRWPYPAARSKFLQHDFYDKVKWDFSSADSCDVLCLGSDDEETPEQRTAKRARRVKLSNAYLREGVLLIPSAALTVLASLPRNEHVAVNDAAQGFEDLCTGQMVGGESISASSRQRNGHVQTHVETEIGGSNGINASDLGGASKNPRNDRRLSAVVERTELEASTSHDNDGEPGCPRHRPPGTRRVVDTKDFENRRSVGGSKKLSFGRAPAAQTQASNSNKDNDFVPTILHIAKGMGEAKRLSAEALHQAMSQQNENMPGNTITNPPQPRNEIEDPKLIDDDEDHEPNIPGRLAPSPFLFRRGKRKRDESRTAEHENSRTIADDEECANNPFPTISTEDVDEPKKIDPKNDYDRVTTPNTPPIVRQYTNATIRRSDVTIESPQTICNKLKAAMRASGATFAGQIPAPPSTPSRSPLQPKTGNGTYNNQTSLYEKADHDNEDPLASAILVSTQAALREAHLDLLKTSPQKAHDSPERRWDRAAQEPSHSPAPAVTPFANLHKRITHVRHATPEVQLSTQGMLQAFSPFQISPSRESQTPASQTRRRQPAAVPASLDDPSAHAQYAKLDDGGWSFATPHDITPSAATNATQISQDTNRGHARKKLKSKTLGFKVIKSFSESSSKSDDMAVKPLTTDSTDPPISRSDVNKSMGQYTSNQFLNALKEEDAHATSSRLQPSPQAKGHKSLQWNASTPTALDLDHDSSHPHLPGVSETPGISHLTPVSPTHSPQRSPDRRVRLSWHNTLEQGPNHTTTPSQLSIIPSFTPINSLLGTKSALRRVEMQDAQRDDDDEGLDLDETVAELGGTVLGSWDVERAMRGGVGAA